MKAAELLKPRFEIIAEYPDNHFGKVGDILDRDWAKYPNGDDSREPEWRISNYPHIFRELKWWEYRKQQDMPKKLICKAIPGDKEIIEIEEWDMENLIGWRNKQKRECASLNSFNYEYGYFPVD